MGAAKGRELNWKTFQPNQSRGLSDRSAGGVILGPAATATCSVSVGGKCKTKVETYVNHSLRDCRSERNKCPAGRPTLRPNRAQKDLICPLTRLKAAATCCDPASSPSPPIVCPLRQTPVVAPASGPIGGSISGAGPLRRGRALEKSYEWQMRRPTATCFAPPEPLVRAANRLPPAEPAARAPGPRSPRSELFVLSVLWPSSERAASCPRSHLSGRLAGARRSGELIRMAQ